MPFTSNLFSGLKHMNTISLKGQISKEGNGIFPQQMGAARHIKLISHKREHLL